MGPGNQSPLADQPGADPRSHRQEKPDSGPAVLPLNRARLQLTPARCGRFRQRQDVRRASSRSRLKRTFDQPGRFGAQTVSARGSNAPGTPTPTARMLFQGIFAALTAACAASNSAARSVFTPWAGVTTRTLEKSFPRELTTPAAIFVPPRSRPRANWIATMSRTPSPRSPSPPRGRGSPESRNLVRRQSGPGKRAREPGLESRNQRCPSPPWGRGWPATALSSAGAGRVRGSKRKCTHRHSFPNRDWTAMTTQIPTRLKGSSLRSTDHPDLSPRARRVNTIFSDWLNVNVC